MSESLLRANFDREVPMISHGRGAILFDQEGVDYIDGSSGAMVANIGHGVKEIAEAAAAQISAVAYTYRTQFRNPAAEALAEKLLFHARDKSRAFLLSSGSEATEAAMRLALQYWRETGIPTKRRILSRRVSYHGNTLGALSLSSDARRQAVADLVVAEPLVQPCYCYRCPLRTMPDRCDVDCANLLEDTIQQIGANNVAAFITEPIIGASGGAVVPHAGYMRRIREICDKYNILLIVDEVITGLGRTGEWFAMHHWNVSSDITILGKGMNAGFTPLSAILINNRVVDAITRGSRQVSFGHTHSGNPSSAAIGYAVLKYIEDHDLVNAASEKGRCMGENLRGLTKDFPFVGDVRGLGMLWGIEFVEPESDKKPFPIESRVTDQVVAIAQANGLIIYPCRGLVNSERGDAIIVAPPLTIDQGELGTLFERLETTLREVQRSMAI